MREQRAVEVSALVLSSTCKRTDVSIARIDSHHRALYLSATARLRLDRGSLAPNRTIGRDLGVAIQRRSNSEIDDVGAATLDDRIDDGAHGVDGVRIVRILWTPLVARDSEWLRLETRKSVRRDVSFPHHETEHEIAPREGAVRMTP